MKQEDYSKVQQLIAEYKGLELFMKYKYHDRSKITLVYSGDTFDVHHYNSKICTSDLYYMICNCIEQRLVDIKNQLDEI